MKRYQVAVTMQGSDKSIISSMSKAKAHCEFDRLLGVLIGELDTGNFTVGRTIVLQCVEYGRTLPHSVTEITKISVTL